MHGDSATRLERKGHFSIVNEYPPIRPPGDSVAAEAESLRLLRVSVNRDTLGEQCTATGFFRRDDLDQQQIEAITRRVPGGAENIQDIQPLSPCQESILFHYLLNEQSDTYVLSALFELSRDTPSDQFVGALQRVVVRHAALRSVLVWEELPRPLQVVCRQLTLPVEELPLHASHDPIEELEQWMRPGRERLHLRGTSPLRLQLTTDAGGRRYALLHVHAVFCDSQSLNVVLGETLACLQGREHQLAKPVDYRTYLESALERASTSDAKAFLRATLESVEETTAPFRFATVHGNGSQFRVARRCMESDLVQKVRAHATRRNVSTASLLHAAWALVLARTSERDEVTYGAVLSPSRRTSPRPMVRTFDNTLPQTLQLAGLTVQQLVKRTHVELQELRRHEEASLVLAQGCTGIRHTAPPFGAVLHYRQQTLNCGPDLGTATGVRVLAIGETWSNCPITLLVDDQEDGFVLTAQTDGRIDPQRITGYMHSALLSVVDGLENAPQTPALSLSVLPSSEREQVVCGFNATHAAYPQGELIHELFEEQAERTPDTVAVVCGQQSLTYAELNRRANKLARYLRDREVGPDQLVGICVERSLDLVVGWLGILKAGGAYVPLDPTCPPERLAYMLKDASPKLLLTQRRLLQRLPADAAEVIELDGDVTGLGQQSTANLDRSAVGLRPHHLAYVLYTSGSTGLPKGVMIEHRNFVNVVHSNCESFGLREGTRCSCVAAVGFDACTWEILPPLCGGATLIIAASERSGDVEQLLTWWAEQSLDVSFLPTPLAELAFSRNTYPAGLRKLLVGGDQLRHRPASASFELINNYGPTESTVIATSGLIRDDDSVLHIGRPIANTAIYILDSYGQVVPIGVAGELYIGGAGVARGYLNRPELTAERFVPDPFGTDSQVRRLYKTGDLGRWRQDGTIEYLGRNDDQVKVRGYRIELGEIEAQLARHAQIKEVLVIAREDLAREKRLVAYFTQRDESDMNVGELRAHLLAVLPDYMVPSAFVRMEGWPLTVNGKVDRRALPAPDSHAYASREYVPPSGELEQTLAEIWQQLLGAGHVGRHDDFFELGGHSLLAMQVAARIQALFSVEVPIQLLFESRTVQDLALAVDDLRRRRLIERIENGGEEVEELLHKVAAITESEVEELLRELRAERKL